ncbi:hypothetical protein OPQ81_011918 [Rhizoctonia solani]|nr:hypothetical protein OPQ81_011918 [Rhizoctonia solani]
MAVTRSGARLANAKGKQVKQVKDEEVDDPMLLDAASVESEYEQSEDEESPPKPSPRKRQRSSAKPAKAQASKKHVRGKQGRLAGLVNMPIDIFTEIASYLMPIDIISLSRANRFFRNMLMNRSSGHVWHRSMRNIRGLPPCPPDLSEPYYLSLLFSKHCTMCGQSVRCRMDEILRVKLCVSCRDEHLTPLDGVSLELRSLVHHSGRIIPSRRRWGAENNHVWKAQVREVEQRLQELRDSGDELALRNWEEQQRAAVLKRREDAIVIQEFLDTVENDREHELREMKNARRRDIENRLVELGWDKKDMQFMYHFPARKEWYSLVEQPKPLTERTWSNLQPRLIPILEANREARLQKELSERQGARRIRLVHLLSEIEKSQSPILDVVVHVPIYPQNSSSLSEPGSVSHEAGSSNAVAELQSSNDNPVPAEASSDTSPTHPANTGGAVKISHTNFRGIFPDIVDALEWPVVKSLHETDTSVDEMEQNFVEHRAEIDTAIAEWQTATHALMAEMLRRDQDIGDEPLTPRLIVTKGDSNPFANLSDDLKLLLRADSLFTGSPINGQRKVINSYDMILTRFGYRLAFKEGIMSRPYKRPFDLSRIQVCSEMRQVARVLLADMGLENASVVELQSMGRWFACARCHDSGLKTWENLVLHFVEAKEVFARVQKHADQLETLKITYRDIHDPEVFPDRRLVEYTPHTNGNPTRGCIICSKYPITQEVRGSEVAIIQHLKDVHDITEPQLGTHFSNSASLHSFGFDSSLDLELDIDTGMFFTHFGGFDPNTDPLLDAEWW